MKYTDEYRDKAGALALSHAIGRITTRSWRIMEVCGGQTHAIARYRIESLLPREVRLLHGPGCPVCVTPAEIVDRAIDLALRQGVVLVTFGDMMRVPGSDGNDLLKAKAMGADVRMAYSPLDAVGMAARMPDRETVFFAIGFETTLAAHLSALKEAIRLELPNFSLLTSFFSVAPAMEAILGDASCEVDGFLAAGHVCAVTGNAACRSIAKTYGRPVVVTGFEPLDLLYGIYHCILALERGEAGAVVNAYKRTVPEDGNLRIRALMDTMLEVCDGEWRGLGVLPASCLRLGGEFEAYDAHKRFPAAPACIAGTASACIAGDIMRGKRRPSDCPHFGLSCSPEHPGGASMVSSEGACAADYRYLNKTS
jgi:hydrogenase expression/formation protein HypD